MAGSKMKDIITWIRSKGSEIGNPYTFAFLKRDRDGRTGSNL
jgi:hypothetical protein